MKSANLQSPWTPNKIEKKEEEKEKEKEERRQMLCRGLRGETTQGRIFHWVRRLERSNSMDLSFMAAQVRRLSTLFIYLFF